MNISSFLLYVMALWVIILLFITPFALYMNKILILEFKNHMIQSYRAYKYYYIDSKYITDLRNYHTNLSDALYDKFIITYEICGSFVKDHPSFLTYCFYHHRHRNPNNIHKINIPIEYKQTFESITYHGNFIAEHRLNGISAISASILSPCENINKTRSFIETLLNYGFQPNNNDILLAIFKLYENIENKVKLNIIHFLLNNTLLAEINKYIIIKLIDHYKDKFYLLPH